MKPKPNTASCPTARPVKKDTAQFHKVGQEFGVAFNPRYDLGMLAVQGPKAIEKLLTVKPEWADVIHSLKPFQGADLGNDWFVARTGYTGEDGVEVILPGTEAVAFFKALQAAGVQPCGLGARDTLRMEAGMNLYGNDMDDNTSPLEAGMGWTVDLKDESRDFVGKAALLALKEKRRCRQTSWPVARKRRHPARAYGSVDRQRQRRNHQRRILPKPETIHRHRPRTERL